MGAFWSVFIAVAVVAEASAMIRLVMGHGDGTFSTWCRHNVPIWLLTGICGWFVVHVGGSRQTTREAAISTAVALVAAWAAMRLLRALP